MKDYHLPNLTWLLSQYTQPHRYYHNLDHINSMINALNKSIVDDDWHKIIWYAIWYHDCIYNVRIQPYDMINEVASAVKAYDDLKDVLTAQELNYVGKLILATQYHFKPMPEVLKCKGTGTMLDLDLLTFAADYENFKEVNDRIEREALGGFTQAEVNEGRIKFFKMVLNSGYIFTRHFMYLEKDPIARLNVLKYLRDTYDFTLSTDKTKVIEVPSIYNEIWNG